MLGDDSVPGCVAVGTGTPHVSAQHAPCGQRLGTVHRPYVRRVHGGVRAMVLGVGHGTGGSDSAVRPRPRVPHHVGPWSKAPTSVNGPVGVVAVSLAIAAMLRSVRRTVAIVVVVVRVRHAEFVHLARRPLPADDRPALLLFAKTRASAAREVAITGALASRADGARRLDLLPLSPAPVDHHGCPVPAEANSWTTQYRCQALWGQRRVTAARSGARPQRFGASHYFAGAGERHDDCSVIGDGIRAGATRSECLSDRLVSGVICSVLRGADPASDCPAAGVRSAGADAGVAGSQPASRLE